MSAALTVGSAPNPAYAPENFRLPYVGRGYAWVTAVGAVTPASGAWFVIDTANPAATWQAFGLFRTNLSPSAVVQWIVGPNASGASPAYTGTTTAQVDPAYGQCLHVARSPVTGRYCRVQITDSATTSGSIIVSGAYAGPIMQPVVNLDYSSSFGSISQEAVTTTRAGTEIIIPHWEARTYSASFSGLSPNEADVLRDLDYEGRQGSNTLIAPLATSTNIHREAVFGRLRMDSNIGYAGNGDSSRTVKLMVTERIG